MRGLKRGSTSRTRFLAGLVTASVCASMLLGGGAASGATPKLTNRLEGEKLQAEVHKISSEAEKVDDEHDLGGWVVKFAPLITALVAIGGLLATIWKQIGESGRQRTLDREERERARQERFDAQFQQIVENVSSKEGAVRAGAAASIQTFMRPEYTDFHERVFRLLLGALRFPTKDFSDKLLVRTFQQAARTQLSRDRVADAGREKLDLSNCFLARVELVDLDLGEADLAFADMHGSDLSKSDLRRVRGLEANLSGARLQGTLLGEARLNKVKLAGARLHSADLVSAKLTEAIATGASFRDSRMQEVHLEKADLRGADFIEADLNNAYLQGASLDSDALRTIARGALNWRKAHWDDDVFKQLVELSEQDSTP